MHICVLSILPFLSKIFSECFFDFAHYQYFETIHETFPFVRLEYD